VSRRTSRLASRRAACALAWLALTCLPLAVRCPSETGVIARAEAADAEAERSFRVEWEPEPVPRGGSWALRGYVYGLTDYRAGGVRLRVEVLDASGQVQADTYGWVQGDVPPRGRAYFLVTLPARGASYRVTVVSFYPIARGAP
jgi:hypothetical protein